MRMDSEGALAQAIAALQAQRVALGDAIVDAALAPLLARQRQEGTGQQRRHVTVLFLDVVGSTELVRRLDPEDAHALLDSLLAEATQCVQNHGGRVLQYAGDSVLAVWGADGAREDDAERAVHAALALAALGGGERPLLRIGLHSGPVLLGGGVDADGSIRGHTVHLAARMEQSAPPGRVRISRDTWLQVRGVFDLEAQAPLAVKGEPEPLATWMVVAARPRAFRVPVRGIDGAEVPLVGRDVERAELLQALEACRAGGTVQAATVVAEPGLGKSRLLQELQHALEADERPAWLLIGRSQPGGELQPWGLLRDVLAWRLQIADSDSGGAARRCLVDGLAPWLADGGDPERGRGDAELIGQLVGMDFSASPAVLALAGNAQWLHDRALAAVGRWLQGMAASDGSPVVMLLDDLHWADDASLDWVQQLMASEGLPLWVVAGARPALLERRPGWPGATLPSHRVLRLQALDGEARRAFTRALLRRLDRPSPALETLLDRQAEGNPFYAEELLRMLLDDGLVVPSDEDATRWRVRDAELALARLPVTLTGVLQSRIDGLAERERQALLQASIIGPVFWDDALSALDSTAPGALPDLGRRGMVLRHAQSAFVGTAEQAFHHHLLHQAAYDRVLKAERRAGHARAAAWLAARVGDRQDEYLAITAEHYARAGDDAQALDWTERAVQAASQRYATRAAIALATRALASPALQDEERRWRLIAMLQKAAERAGERDIQRQAVEAASALAEQAGKPAWRAQALVGQMTLADRLARRDDARRFAHEAIAVAEAADAAAQATHAWGQLAWMASADGDLPTAHAHLERAYAWGERAAARHRGLEPFSFDLQLRLVGVSLCMNQGRPQDALRLATEACRGAQERRLPRVECAAHEALALALGDLLELDQARLHVGECERLGHLIGMQINEGIVAGLYGGLALRGGHYAEALPWFERARAVRAALRARDKEAEAHQLAGIALLALGRLEEAEAALAEAEAMQLELGLTARAHSSLALRAQIALARDGPVAALARLGPLRAVMHEADALRPSPAPMFGRLALWRVLAAAGDPGAVRQRELVLAERAAQWAPIEPGLRESRAARSGDEAAFLAAWAALEGTPPPPR